MIRAPLQDSYWIHPGLLAGRYPLRNEIPTLVTIGVTMFMDLTETGELPPYSPNLPGGIEYRRMSIRDFAIPAPETMEEILQTLDAALAEGHMIYLHCRGGIGRTGTVVGCHLIRGGMTGKEALLEIRRLRVEAGCDPDSPETAAQRAMVRHWPSRVSQGTKSS